MAQIDDLKAAQARLIDVNKRLITKVHELEAAHVDPAVMQTVIDAATAAATEAEVVAPAPAA